jgi:hypothetical protein
MLDDAVLNGIPQLEHSSLVAGDIISHVNIRLIAGAWNYNIVFGSSYAE